MCLYYNSKYTSYCYSDNICIENLTLKLKEDPLTYATLDGEYNRTFDPNTNRSQWINLQDTNLKWFIRIADALNEQTGQHDYTYNWVLSENGMDTVVCAPEYVDSPLYCTTFIYAGTDSQGDSLNPQLSPARFGQPEIDGGNTIFKMGTCDETPSPTTEPTIEPTMSNEPITCSYNGVTYDIDDTIQVSCKFGYYGSENNGQCSLTEQ